MLRSATKSFLGFPCSACREPITVFTFPSQVPTPRFSGGQSLMTKCPRCGFQTIYQLTAIARYEEHQVN